MASLGRLDFVVQDTSGNVVNGASVEVRRQGAQINGAQAGSPYTVDDVNGVLAGDTVKLNTGSISRTVSSVTATTITTGGGDLGAVSDDDRITIAAALPTIFEDAHANTSTSNPITTGATGRAACYITGGKYDVLISGGGVTTTLLQDQVAIGGETIISNIFTTGSAIAFQLNTLRSLVAADKILSLKVAGGEVLGVGGTGNTSVAGTLTITGATTSAGITNTGAISTTTDTTLRRVLATQGTNLVSGDFDITAGGLWGVGASLAVTAGSKDTRGRFSVTAAGTPGANPLVVLTFKDGTFGATVRAIGCRTDAVAPTTGFWATSPGATGVTFMFVGTPVAGSVYPCDYIVVG